MGFLSLPALILIIRCTPVLCVAWLVHADISDSTEAGKLRRMELKAGKP